MTQGIYVSEGSKLAGPDAVPHGADNGMRLDLQAQPPDAGGGGVGGGNVDGQVVADGWGERGQGLCSSMLTDELISAVGGLVSCSTWLAGSVSPCLPSVKSMRARKHTHAQKHAQAHASTHEHAQARTIPHTLTLTPHTQNCQAHHSRHLLTCNPQCEDMQDPSLPPTTYKANCTNPIILTTHITLPLQGTALLCTL